MSMESIRQLLDKLEEIDTSGVQVAQVSQALADMASSLSAVAQAQERPPAWVGDLIAAIRSLKEDEDSGEEKAPPWVAGFLDALRGVQIVNNVQPAEVSLPPQSIPAAAQMPLMSSGVRMRVTKRDDLGRLSELIFIPEN